MKQKKKKPTINQMETVINNLIMETKRSQIEILRTQEVLNNYIDYKKDVKKFTKYVEEKNDRRENKTSNKTQSDKK